MNTEHYLVPPHRLLSPSEKEEVLKRLKIEAYKLPKILATDPQAVKLKAKPGDIIEIDRGHEGKYYRVVVSA